MNSDATLSYGITGTGLVVAFTAMSLTVILALGLVRLLTFPATASGLQLRMPAVASGIHAGSAAQARAQAPVRPAEDTPAAITGRQALALVSFDPARLGYRIEFRPGRRDLRAQIDRPRRLITIFVSPGDAVHRLAHDVAHELGHAYDGTYLSPEARNSYLQARGRGTAPWWPGFQAKDYTALALSDYGTGAGDFAEVFALCHSPSPEFRSTLAPQPPDACALIPAPPPTPGPQP
jgi:hypothetical protein